LTFPTGALGHRWRQPVRSGRRDTYTLVCAVSLFHLSLFRPSRMEILSHRNGDRCRDRCDWYRGGSRGAMDRWAAAAGCRASQRVLGPVVRCNLRRGFRAAVPPPHAAATLACEKNWQLGFSAPNDPVHTGLWVFGPGKPSWCRSATAPGQPQSTRRGDIRGLQPDLEIGGLTDWSGLAGAAVDRASGPRRHVGLGGRVATKRNTCWRLIDDQLLILHGQNFWTRRCFCLSLSELFRNREKFQKFPGLCRSGGGG
jgi:hypothetical protein